MRPVRIVIADPAGHADPQLGAGFERTETRTLVFHREPQAFNKHIVHPVTAAMQVDLLSALDGEVAWQIWTVR